RRKFGAGNVRGCGARLECEPPHCIPGLGTAPHEYHVQPHLPDRGDAYFGPNLGVASVLTVVRAGYRAVCSNVGAFLNNLIFTLPMENEIMGAILNDGLAPVWRPGSGSRAIRACWRPGCLA